MKISIPYNIIDAFWTHFAPKGLISLVSRTPAYALECIVVGEPEVLEEVKTWRTRGVGYIC